MKDYELLDVISYLLVIGYVFFIYLWLAGAFR